MDKEARAKLMRELVKARKPSSGAGLATKAARFKWWEVYGSGRIAGGDVSLCETRDKPWRDVEWVVTPDAKPEPTVEPKRRNGPNAIATIAAKQPGKLKRRHATAEGLLSERKQQSRP